MAIMNDLADAPAAPPSVGTAAPKAGGSSARYLVIRFLLIIPTIFILVTLVFFLMRVTGDPITAALGGRLTPDQLAERIHAAGYDRPVIVQYFEYLGQIFTGNFGTHDHRQPRRSPRCWSPTAPPPSSWRSTR